MSEPPRLWEHSDVFEVATAITRPGAASPMAGLGGFGDSWTSASSQTNYSQCRSNLTRCLGVGEQKGQLLKGRDPETGKLMVGRTPFPEQLGEISSLWGLSEQDSQERKSQGSVFPASSHLVRSTQASVQVELDLEPKDIA